MAGFEPARQMRGLMRALRYQLRAHPVLAGVERFELSPHGFGDQQATATTYPYILKRIERINFHLKAIAKCAH